MVGLGELAVGDEGLRVIGEGVWVGGGMLPEVVVAVVVVVLAGVVFSMLGDASKKSESPWCIW